MTRQCAECGNAFPARTEHQKFRSSKCRVRNHRADTTGNASQDRVRADVAVRTRSVERAIRGLADAAVELPVDQWTQVWADVAKYMRSEIARVGRGKK